MVRSKAPTPFWKKFLQPLALILLGTAPLLNGCGIEDVGSGFPGVNEPDDDSEDEVTIVIEQGASSRGAEAFGVNPRVVSRNTIVTWINNDTVAHTVTSDSDIWDSGTLNPGAQFSRTFSDAGTFPYFSRTTETMRGSIQVTDDVGGTVPIPRASPSPRVPGLPLPVPSVGP